MLYGGGAVPDFTFRYTVYHGALFSEVTRQHRTDLGELSGLTFHYLSPEYQYIPPSIFLKHFARIRNQTRTQRDLNALYIAWLRNDRWAIYGHISPNVFGYINHE